MGVRVRACVCVRACVRACICNRNSNRCNMAVSATSAMTFLVTYI